MNYLAVIPKIMFQPYEFFESIKEETSYMRPWLFLAIAYAIMTVYNFVASVPIYLSQEMVYLIIFGILGTLFHIAYAFALPWVAAGVAHLGLLIFGAKQGYYNTFKPVSYAGIVYIIYGMISSTISAIFALVNPAEAEIYIGFIALGIALASIAHILVIEVIGVAKFQQISYLRAFLGVIFIPTIILVVVAVMVGGLIMTFSKMPTGMFGLA